MFLRSTDALFVTEFGDEDRLRAGHKAYAPAARSAESKPLFADIPGDDSTTATIAIGDTTSNSLEVVGDTDWFRIELNAGDSIAIALSGSGANPVIDPFVTLRDAAGNVVASNDDGGEGYNSLLNFVSENGGTYYIEVDSYESSYSGDYTLSVNEREPVPHFTYDQIANQLTLGYWDGSLRHFDVGADGDISVNITALTAAGQFFATQALNLWSDVTGINFVQTGGAAEITFDDTEQGAFAASSTSGEFIVSSNVNISTAWIAGDGTNLNSYSFQTYIHEIGHALGLGHAGNYNGDASYATDALYDNDAWSTTVMSYFDQTDNSHFSAQGFSFAFITSPMNADVVAMQTLYGLSSTTRTGDTTYGFNSNANRDIFDATQHADTAYTVIDSDGTDTLDYSGFAQDQRIDLTEEAFSDVGGLTGNIVIARGTVIENAIGGIGADTILGNDARNQLTGGPNADSLFGENGIDTLFGDAGDDSLDGGRQGDQLHGGDGNDTVNGGAGGNDTMWGEAGNDYMRGRGGFDTLIGGSGDDRIQGHSNSDRLEGGSGDDSLSGSSGLDTLNGGAHNDRLSGGASSDTFVFDRLGASHADRVVDFVSGTDKIALDRDVFAELASGPLAPSAFRVGAEAADANDRIVYDQATGELYYDSDGSGGTAKVLFASVDDGLALAYTDFTAFGSPPAAMVWPEFDKTPAADLTSADGFLFA